jgi:hypothetical protein
MKNSQIFKMKFPDFLGAVDIFTSSGEQVNFINTEDNIVEFTATTTARCGCCWEVIAREEGLDFILDFMDNEEFEDFCSICEKQT